MQEYSDKQNNLNKLTELFYSRLSAKSSMKKQDANGQIVYVDAYIFSKEMAEHFFTLSLSEFNATPFFTNYSFEDTRFVDTFAEILVEGAVLQALASKALIERGREFSLTEAGISFIPPSVSEMLHTQYATLLGQHFEKLKLIKDNIRCF